MNRLIEMKQKRTEAIEQARAILKVAQDAGRGMTAEETQSFKELEDKAKSITATIEAAERLADLSNAYTDTAAAITTPAAGANGATGVRPGIDAAQASIQVHDNWTNADILFGRQPMAGETVAQRRSRLTVGFGEQLTAVRDVELNRASGTNRPPDKRLLELQTRYEKRAQAAGASEAVPSDGGFLIQPDFSDEIILVAHETGLVYPRARKIPLSEWTNAIKIPGIAETSRVDGARWGGVRMYWQNEADSLIGTKPQFRLIELVMKKLTGLFYATDELIADARTLGAVVLQAFGEEMGFKLDDGVIEGTGQGQLQGILNSPALVVIPKPAGQLSTTLTYTDVKLMWGRMWARSRKNAVWFINQDTEQQLMGLAQEVGVAGQPVSAYGNPGAPAYIPPGVQGGGDTGTLFGRPVIAIEQAQTLGTQGDIILADLSQYLFADKGDMQTAVSMHVRFLTDEMTYRWVYRCDGQGAWFSALTPFHGGNTLSPFITLAAR